MIKFRRLKMWWSGSSNNREIMLKVAELNHVEISIPLEQPLIKTFWLKHWKFIVSTTLTIVGLIIAFMAFVGSTNPQSNTTAETTNKKDNAHIETPIK